MGSAQNSREPAKKRKIGTEILKNKLQSIHDLQIKFDL